MHTIKDSALIAATPARILEALTTKAGFRGWWTTDVDCDERAREATFTFEKNLGSVNGATFRLDGADERKVAMTCVREQNQKAWLGTTLVFELVPDGTATRVELVHAGYPAQDEMYANCVKGWSFFLGSLKSYLETGKGTPHVRASQQAA